MGGSAEEDYLCRSGCQTYELCPHIHKAQKPFNKDSKQPLYDGLARRFDHGSYQNEMRVVDHDELVLRRAFASDANRLGNPCGEAFMNPHGSRRLHVAV